MSRNEAGAERRTSVPLAERARARARALCTFFRAEIDVGKRRFLSVAAVDDSARARDRLSQILRDAVAGRVDSRPKAFVPFRALNNDSRCDTRGERGATAATCRPRAMDALGRASKRARDAAPPLYAYPGVQIVHPRMFEGAPAGAFSTNVMWDRAIAAGQLSGTLLDGVWIHVGTPEARDEAETYLKAPA